MTTDHREVYKIIIYWTIGLFVFLIIWEHIAAEVICTNHWKPSFVIMLCYEHCRSMFISIGGWLAYFSSYLYRLKLERFLHSGWSVIRSTLQLVLSPFYILRGYFDGAWSYDNPWVIFTGSIILCGIVIWWFWPYMVWIYDFLHISNPSIATYSTFLICIASGVWACYARIQYTATAKYSP